MRMMVAVGIVGCVVLLIFGLAHFSPESPPPVRTKFERGSELKPQELKDVIKLGEQCGISNPVAVSTQSILPVGGVGISIQAKELRQGRDTYYDILAISREGWTDWRFAKDLKQVGQFTASPKEKYTVHMRDFPMKNRILQVRIDENVDVTVADIAIPKIVLGEVGFSDLNGSTSNEFSTLDVSEPKSISFDSNWGEYELLFEKGRMFGVRFKVENGKVIVRFISSVDI